MQSLVILNKMSSDLNKIGYSGHDGVERLQEENRLESLMGLPSFNEILKYEITQYLDMLFDDSFSYRYLKKIRLEQMTSDPWNWTDLYMLAVYSGDKKAYRDLPLLLKQLIDKLNIEDYKYVTIEDLKSYVYKNFDIKDGYDENIEKDTCEIITKLENSKYKKYENTYNYNKPNTDDKHDFSVWAEHKTFDDELSILKKRGLDNYVIWAARDFGDGYGFDVLTIDLNVDREKLIEVKSGKHENFSLTETETKVMRNCRFKNADYYVYKYTYYEDVDTTKLNVFRYNPKLDMLIDQYNNYYSLREYEEHDENGKLVTKFAADKVELDKNKVLTKN